MANCFTTIFLWPNAPALQNDIGAVFPAVDRLDIFCSDKCTVENCLSIDSQLMTVHLQLLAKLVTVNVSTPAWRAAPLATLASRCTSLRALHVILRGVSATFKGHGATPAEQRAHLQQMLAAPSPTPALFSPPAPLARNCLRSLTLDISRLSNATKVAECFLVHHPATTAPPANKPSSTDKPSSTELFSSLAHLSSLTHLDVSSDGGECASIFSGISGFFGGSMAAGNQAAYDAVLKAVAHLPQLRHLQLSGPREPWRRQPSGTCPLGSSWAAACANLTQLTSLALSNLRVDLGSLVSLQLLQDLRIETFRGDITSLFRLTALTSLSLGMTSRAPSAIAHLDAQQDAPFEGSLSTDLPSAWRTGLKRLVWKFDSPLDPAALGMLGALKYLAFSHQRITFEFAWALARLPLLEQISGSSCGHESLQHHEPPPLHERPVLKSLRHVTDQSGKNTMSLVNILANWTRLPSSGRLLHVDLAGMDDHHPAARLQRWSPCWLQALLRCTHKQRFLFLTEADALSFCAAAEAVGPSFHVRPHLHVGPQLPPDAFERLVCTVERLSRNSWWLGGWSECLGKVPDEMHMFGFIGDDGEVPDLSYVGVAQLPERDFVLTQQHVQGLPAGSLASLAEADVDGADPDMAAVISLMRAAPHLQHLKLSNLTQFDIDKVQSILDATQNDKLRFTMGWEDSPEAQLAQQAVSDGLARSRAARGFARHATPEELARYNAG